MNIRKKNNLPDNIVKKGFVKAMDGEKLHVHTTTGERVTFELKDRDKQWDLYCTPVKITIEPIHINELK